VALQVPAVAPFDDHIYRILQRAGNSSINQHYYPCARSIFPTPANRRMPGAGERPSVLSSM